LEEAEVSPGNEANPAVKVMEVRLGTNDVITILGPSDRDTFEPMASWVRRIKLFVSSTPNEV
jgi:hypothetical protein